MYIYFRLAKKNRSLKISNTQISNPKPLGRLAAAAAWSCQTSTRYQAVAPKGLFGRASTGFGTIALL